MFRSVLFNVISLAILIIFTNSQLTTRSIECPANQRPCGIKCYSPETHKCNSGFICPKDEGWCGNKCYNVTAQKCIWGLICRITEQWCANKCFDPSTQQCRQGRLSYNNATNR